MEIWKNKDQGKAHYKNLQTCGSVWSCPICAAKISERRRKEVEAAIKNWMTSKGSVFMVTQTVPHYAHQSLKEVLGAFTRSRGLMRNRKPWKKMAKRIGLAGTLRALEVTYGASGWHVHAHEILFIFPGFAVDPLAVQGEIYFMWRDACKTAGLSEPSWKRGVQVQDGQYAGEYASKWGIESEISKAHLKAARGEGNYSPWDLLREFDKGRKEFGDLFREYSKAFKGKRQLVWSEGMWELAGLKEKMSDEEIAARGEEGSEFLMSLGRNTWRLVKESEKRGELLQVAEESGEEGIIQLIRELQRKAKDEQ